ncbi:MAG TPA: hypothetical protein VKQ29_12735 [Aliidongia sp.]|nr:hypothetical protein [Aliidongia sp.]
MDELRRKDIRKGRGALSNAVGRFEGYERLQVDDGWGAEDEPVPLVKTSLTADTTRTIIARNRSPDVPFDRSINMYRGCEHVMRSGRDVLNPAVSLMRLASALAKVGSAKSVQD